MKMYHGIVHVLKDQRQASISSPPAPLTVSMQSATTPGELLTVSRSR